MILKIISTILILFSVYMGIKQGWAMVTGKPEMITMLGRLGVGTTEAMIIGGITIGGAFMVLFPSTFLVGNFTVAVLILYIMCLELLHKDLKAAAIEIPFLLLSLVIIYLGHPLSKNAPATA